MMSDQQVKNNGDSYTPNCLLDHNIWAKCYFASHTVLIKKDCSLRFESSLCCVTLYGQFSILHGDGHTSCIMFNSPKMVLDQLDTGNNRNFDISFSKFRC